MSQWPVEATQPLTASTAQPEPLKVGVLLYLTVLSDISPQPFPVMVLLPPIVSALGDGPRPNAHNAFGVWISAIAVAPILTVLKPSTAARYAGWLWLTIARTRLLVG